MVWIKFIVCILVIYIAGKNVAKHGDIIAEKSGLGGVWIGLILIAFITSLPELFTGISAVTLVNAPDLTVGNLIGANAFNLFNLALLDIAHKNSSLLDTASPTHRLTAWFSLVMMAVVAISIIISSVYPMAIGWIGWYTPVIILLYVFSVRKIFLFDQRQLSSQEVKLYYEEESTVKACLYFSISAVFIIGAGIWLATIGDEIALSTGWGKSFVGSLLLAFTTTLPEITVSFSAMRMGAKDLAIANLIGSNLFNLTIIPLDDLIYRKGPILAAVSEGNIVSAVAVILMTLVFIAALRFKPERFHRLSWWNCSLIALFIIGTYLSFNMA